MQDIKMMPWFTPVTKRLAREQTLRRLLGMIWEEN
jgi:hypothetical protein